MDRSAKQARAMSLRNGMLASVAVIQVLLMILLPSLAASMPCPETQCPEELNALQTAGSEASAGDKDLNSNRVPIEEKSAERIDPHREQLISKNDGCTNNPTAPLDQTAIKRDEIEKMVNKLEGMFLVLFSLQFFMLLMTITPLSPYWQCRS